MNDLIRLSLVTQVTLSAALTTHACAFRAALTQPNRMLSA
jgi:hypothetical protein